MSSKPHDTFALVFVEPVVRDQQGAADPIQRVVLAAPMPERGLLDPAADVIDRRRSPSRTAWK